MPSLRCWSREDGRNTHTHTHTQKQTNQKGHSTGRPRMRVCLDDWFWLTFSIGIAVLTVSTAPRSKSAMASPSTCGSAHSPTMRPQGSMASDCPKLSRLELCTPNWAAARTCADESTTTITITITTTMSHSPRGVLGPSLQSTASRLPARGGVLPSAPRRSSS